MTKDKLLIVVDMQNDFVSGVLGNDEAKAIVPNVVEKVKNWDGDLIFTADTHENDYLNTLEGKKLPIKHCIKDTNGWEIIPELKDYSKFTGHSTVIKKNTFGFSHWKVFLSNPYGKYQYDEVHLIGLDLDICVITNALIIKTQYPDTEVFVDVSCCAGSTPAKYKAAIEVLKSCQINVIGENNV